MKSKICRLLAASALAVCLCGCSHTDETLEAQTLEIAMADSNVLGLQIPKDWELEEQDGFHYWGFTNGSKIYRSKIPVATGDKKGDCYYSTYAVSRNYADGYTITISTDKKIVDQVGNLLQNSSEFKRESANYREREIKHLPEYDDFEMAMSTNNLYMPLEYNEVTSDVFSACHSLNGESYVTCWIMDYSLDDLRPMLNNLVTANAGKITHWYEGDGIYWAATKTKTVCAKKLAYNQWCCYLTSNDSYRDYAIKAMHSITGK